jgi:3-oxocholest-4-en-26-oate---CoA ligase
MSPWNLGDLFEAVVDAVPDHEAVVDGATRLTYRQLDERANRVAGGLAARGIGPGDAVAIALRNGHEHLELVLGLFKLGAVGVNVNVRYTAAEVRALLTDAGAVAVVHEPDLAPLVQGVAALRVLVARGPAYEAMLAAASPTRLPGPRDGDATFLLYTGGTTGAPKGVEWRHEDLFFAALSGGNPGGDPVTSVAELAERATEARGRCLPASPFSHGTAHWTALTTLLLGGTVVVGPCPHFDAAATWDLVAREAVTMLVIVGDAFARPLVDALAAQPDRWDLDELLVVVSGGAVLSPNVRTALLDLLPSVAVVDGYGTSETGGQGHHVTWPGQAAPGSTFTMDPHTDVLDAEGRRAPVGAVGRIARRGRLPLGYLGDPGRTAATFPVVEGVRWAVPGDLGRREADGTITLLGRGSSSINSGGEKIFPAEVEAALREHPHVADAVVVGLPDDRWGERVAAVVEVGAGATTTEDELVAHCRDRLARFKVPRRIVIVDHLERQPTGKADHRWAVEAALSGWSP